MEGVSSGRILSAAEALATASVSRSSSALRA